MKIGIDIQDTAPFKRLVGTPKMGRMFSAYELEYLATKNFAPQSMAGLFSAKEALFKALGTGIQKSKLSQYEVLHDKNGMPHFDVEGLKLSLSISHTKTTAVSVVIIENNF